MRGRGKRRSAGKPRKPPPKAIKCAVCGEGDGKYKCPKCRMPFCCVQCSKDHKENQCPALKGDAAKSDATATSKGGEATANKTSEYLSQKELKADQQPKRKRPRRTSGDESDDCDDEPGWNITDEMKERLRRSSWLHKELRDGGLRQLIDQIDGASDGEEEGERNTRQYQGKKGGARISPRELALARTKHGKPKFATFVDRMLLTAGVLQPASGGVDAGTGEGGLIEILEGPAPLVMAPVPRRRGADAGSAEKSEESESSNDSDGDSDGSDSSEDSTSNNGSGE
ncbi:hypothetical protein ACHAXT_011881 [Thalassiosira profunda]